MAVTERLTRDERKVVRRWLASSRKEFAASGGAHDGAIHRMQRELLRLMAARAEAGMTDEHRAEVQSVSNELGAAASAQAPSRCGGGLPNPRTAGAPSSITQRISALLDAHRVRSSVVGSGGSRMPGLDTSDDSA